ARCKAGRARRCRPDAIHSANFSFGQERKSSGRANRFLFLPRKACTARTKSARACDAVIHLGTTLTRRGGAIQFCYPNLGESYWGNTDDEECCTADACLAYRFLPGHGKAVSSWPPLRGSHGASREPLE